MTAEPLVGPARARVQRRTVTVLAVGQVLGGVAHGATVALGALLAADLSGDDALSGFAASATTLGAAACAIPLARLAARWGRRRALNLGNLAALAGIALIVTAASVRSFGLLLVGITLVGAGNAGGLQSRFAATDLAEPQHRGRDLSLVVWATTAGGVTGPLLLAPGEILGATLGMPEHTGSYVFSFAAQCLAFLLYFFALRPDPLLSAQRIARAEAAAQRAQPDQPALARFAMFAAAGSHVVMVSVMAMTPIHIAHLVTATHPAGHDTAAQVSALVGVTIALHVGGMYALSPVFGMLADRWGRLRTLLLGQALLAAALVCTITVSGAEVGVIVALILLGLGWSASTVSAAALLTEASAVDVRPRRQGRSDSLMSLCAAIGAAGSGAVLSAFQYRGLGMVTMGIVIAIVIIAVVVGARSARVAQAADARHPGP